MSVTADGGRKSFIADADLSAKRYFIMKFATADNEIGIASGATNLLVGTLNNKPKEGEGANLTLRGGGVTGKVVAGATVTKGARITTDSAGKAIITTTAANEVLGIALEDAVSGDIFEYMPATGLYAIT